MMVRLAPRRRRPKGFVEPIYSFQTLLRFTGAFFCCVIILLILLRSGIISSRSGENVRQRLFSSPNELPINIVTELDAILVLGGGSPMDLESPPSYVQNRCDSAARVVKRHAKMAKSMLNLGQLAHRRRHMRRNELLFPEPSLPIVCLSAGTAHVPQLLSIDGLPIWESTSCAAYLSSKHNLTSNVFVETTSYDTIGNAYYARTTITDIKEWSKILVVTSEFHMLRTIAIFDWIFGMEQTTTTTAKKPYDLFYLSTPNVGLTDEAIHARITRETQSLKTIQEKLAPQYKSLQEVLTFLTEDHALYTASKLVDRGREGADAIHHDEAAALLVKQSYGGDISK